MRDMTVDYLTPAKPEVINVAMEFENVRQNFCTFWSKGIITNFQLREKNMSLHPKREKKS